MSKLSNDELRLTHMNAIIILTPQGIAFKGNDKCDYYGTNYKVCCAK